MLALTPRRPLRQIVRSLTTTATAVHVHPDGITVPALHTCFPHLWLRDTCQCPRCIHPSTRQKYHRLSDVPIDVRPISVRLTASVLATPASTDRTLAIDWTDGHVSQHPLSLLTRYSSPAHLSAFHRDTPRTPWSSSTFSQVPDQVLPYEALAKPAGLLSALTQLIRYGILFLTGVPTTYVNDDSRSCCETSKLAQMLGEIRPTFYGEMWDVKNIVDSRNIAYTDLDLGLHVDLSYFEHPPHIQILHCLRNRVAGGVSLFADGLHAAHVLRASHPDDFAVLASIPVPFQYINDGHHLHHAHCTIELEHSTPEPTVKYINYSPLFQAPFALFPRAVSESLPRLHAALERFANVLDAPESRIKYQLREGDVVLLDNRRILHGRTAFRAVDGGSAGEANRWLRGCYLEVDTVLDRARVLRTKLEPTPTD